MPVVHRVDAGDFEATAFQLRVFWHVALAMALGAVIGIEREAAAKPAGLRTHMLVAGAAALLVGLGPATILQFESDLGGSLRTDPIRIIEAVITGVSFLGAGTILRGAAGEVTGLTTAASLLFAAATGATVAVSQWPLAVGVTGLVVVILHAPPALSQWQQRKKSRQSSCFNNRSRKPGETAS